MLNAIMLNVAVRPIILKAGNTKGGSITTVDLIFDWFGISCMTTDNFHFYLQTRLIQTGQTGGQLYSDTSPFNAPCRKSLCCMSPCLCMSMHPNCVKCDFSPRHDFLQILHLFKITIGDLCAAYSPVLMLLKRCWFR
jgi:hypothetical protein